MSTNVSSSSHGVSCDKLNISRGERIQPMDELDEKVNRIANTKKMNKQKIEDFLLMRIIHHYLILRNHNIVYLRNGTNNRIIVNDTNIGEMTIITNIVNIIYQINGIILVIAIY